MSEIIRGFDVVSDEKVGSGGFLEIRRLRLKLVRADGTLTAQGLYDFIERPMGLDAVVLALWHRRASGSVDVLLRESVRVPVAFGRPDAIAGFTRIDRAEPSEEPRPQGASEENTRRYLTSEERSGRGPQPARRRINPSEARYELRTMFELVAGILEAGEDDFAALQHRAAAEAYEEAGLLVSAAEVERLGPPLFPTPGMCAEKFHFAACRVDDPAAAVRPLGDGSPFEEGARLHWLDLDEALGRFASGDFDDMKSELGLRRLRDHLR